MTAQAVGIRKWGLSSNRNSTRTYELVWLVVTTEEADGPAVVRNASGLAVPGSYWDFGNDEDIWAFCTHEKSVERWGVVDGEIGIWWLVTQVFTTDIGSFSRCSELEFDNPLAEPARVSGGYVRYIKEATHDKDGNLLLMSSGERMKGEPVEVDEGRPTVQIGINSATLPLTTFTDFRGKLNNATLWGLPPRCVKLADVIWRRFFYGTCTYYYQIDYTFDIKLDTWNRFIPDKGTQVLIDSGNRTNFKHFKKARDIFGEPIEVYLDGEGNQALTEAGVFIHEKKIEKERNLLLLGIPTSL